MNGCKNIKISERIASKMQIYFYELNYSMLIQLTCTIPVKACIYIKSGNNVDPDQLDR